MYMRQTIILRIIDYILNHIFYGPTIKGVICRLQVICYNVEGIIYYSSERVTINNGEEKTI